ncbi:Permease of the drug/metabolite transporter (DMT) superfamily [Tangfeifania diversioriginum]|uniref:Permease of the drug/metabolite transporter (DMT) superfamily n=1 Tax=Tangfeifania diversioriginum TaxID=1168035 RepID=A0A1M6KPT6_9BACT|nr:DMT family transporter [Tangfeifania diversioriginum]SHJ60979.1 Permease of the drug/metabolite transporter (DMT) superfamily [Tangfeifania diversioriginum]
MKIITSIPSGKQKNLFLAIGFVLFWNSGFIGAEYGLPYTGPFTLVFWRYLALTILIFLYLLIKKRFRRINRPVIAYNMLVGFLAHGIWLSCVLLALEQDVPAGIIALVVALQPLATGAFSGIVVGEPTPVYRWLGLIIGFGGVAITVLSRIDFNTPESVFGYLIPLGSVIAITVATLIQRKMDIINTNYRLPLDLTLFYQSLATMAVLAIPAIFAEKLATQWEPEFIFTMIWLTVGVSLVAYALMWRLVERLDATRVASLFYLGPPVTMLMAWIAFGDTLQIMDITGLAVVFAGVMLTLIKMK